MFEALARSEPVSAQFYDGAGAGLSLAAPMARHSLRARRPETLEHLLGFELPRKIGAIMGGAACLGPDEWLLRGPVAATVGTGAGLPVSITQISDRSVCLLVEGPRAAEVLAAGCPLDLDRFVVERATRTVFDAVEIILLHTGENRFEVEVWRSFAPWLKQALEAAARQLR